LPANPYHNVCTDKRIAWSSPVRQEPEAPACVFTS
jgi:hypothetical protein